MASNITTNIKTIKDDNRLSEKTREQARKLEKYIGTSRPIPSSLEKEIRENKSKSDSVKELKQYIEKK